MSRPKAIKPNLRNTPRREEVRMFAILAFASIVVMRIPKELRHTVSTTRWADSSMYDFDTARSAYNCPWYYVIDHFAHKIFSFTQIQNRIDEIRRLGHQKIRELCKVVAFEMDLKFIPVPLEIAALHAEYLKGIGVLNNDGEFVNDEVQAAVREGYLYPAGLPFYRSSLPGSRDKEDDRGDQQECG